MVLCAFMDYKKLLFFIFCVIFITENVVARRFSVSRSRGSSSRGSSTSLFGRGSSSSGFSLLGRGSSTSSRGTSTSNHGSLSGGYGSHLNSRYGSQSASPPKHQNPTSSSNKDASKLLIHAEGGGTSHSKPSSSSLDTFHAINVANKPSVVPSRTSNTPLQNTATVNQPSRTNTYPTWANPHLNPTGSSYGTSGVNKPSIVPSVPKEKPSSVSTTHVQNSGAINQPSRTNTYPTWGNPHLNPTGSSHVGTTNLQNHGVANQGNNNNAYPAWGNPYLNPSQPVRPNIPVGFDKNPNSPSAPPPYPGISFPSLNRAPYPSIPNHPLPNSGITNSRFPNSPPYPINPSFGTSSLRYPNSPSYSNNIHYSSNPPVHMNPPFSNVHYPTQMSSSNFGNSHHPIGGTYYPQQSQFLAQPAAHPYVPGQTVIMVPQNSGSSSRGIGDMFKEALVFSTVNAGVNRIINPPHYHHHYTDNPSSVPLTGGSTSTVTHTHIVNNHNTYNNYDNGSANSSGVPNHMGEVPVNNNLNQFDSSNPGNVLNHNDNRGIISKPNISTDNANTGGTLNKPYNTGETTKNVINANQTTNSTNATADPNFWPAPQYRITENELISLTEELFVKAEFDVNQYLVINLQNRSNSVQNTTANITDNAQARLFHVEPEAYEIPTIKAIRNLYGDFERNATVKENITSARREKENFMLNTFLNTNVMEKTMKWLAERSFIDPDDFDRKDILREIWFTVFEGSTSGFERIFMSEIYGNSDILGVQDWIYFDYLESMKHINYMSYVDKLNLDQKSSLLKINFKMNDIVRPNATLFVGTLPELEMALYTVCFYARPNDICPVSLGGTRFNIYTHSFHYYRRDLIDLALVIF